MNVTEFRLLRSSVAKSVRFSSVPLDCTRLGRVCRTVHLNGSSKHVRVGQRVAEYFSLLPSCSAHRVRPRFHFRAVHIVVNAASGRRTYANASIYYILYYTRKTYTPS